MDLMLESKAVAVDRCQNHHQIQALRYLGVQNKDDMKPSSTTKSSVSGKKTFSQVIKVVFCEIILGKRIRDRKAIDQELYSSANSKFNYPLTSRDKLLDTSSFDQSVINKVLPNSAQQEERQQVQNKCNTYNSHNRECEMKPKQDGICKGTNSSCNRAILLLLISLAATIFCGKIVAILITSICLYFLPRQQHPIGVGENLGNIERSPENKSRDYKRVIMKGLLERNHNRGAFNFLT